MNAPFNPTPRREAMRIAGRLVTTDDVIAGCLSWEALRNHGLPAGSKFALVPGLYVLGLERREPMTSPA